MFFKLALAFTVIPLVEAYLLIQVGSAVGPLNTVLFMLLTGVFGAWIAKREGIAVLRQVALDLRQGLPPALRLVEGALVLVGAVLLITPGVLTDLTGILLVFPWTRRLLAPVVLRSVASRFTVEALGSVRVGDAAREPSADPRQPRPTPFDHPVR